MSLKTALFYLLFVCLLLTSVSNAEDITPFLGRWALFLGDGAGWLEVRQEDGYIDADLLWYGGSVVPVENVYVHDENLVVTRISRMVRKRDEKGEATRIQNRTESYVFSFFGETLVGKQIAPNSDGLGVSIKKFTVKKIPPLPPAPDLSELKFGKPIKLFNGKDLSGWELTNPDDHNGFKAVNEELVNDPVQKEGQPRIHYGNLKTSQEFEDFNLKLQVNVPKGSNSGVYLRGIYEVQISDSYGQELDSHNMGAIYSRLTPSVAAEKPAGEWQDFDIILCDRHVNVILNGKTIIENQPLLGVTGGALTACQFSPGPIYLQGDHGKISYRNIVLRPILKE